MSYWEVCCGRSRTQARGFTLIELLVVIAIIGLLSSVVMASLTTARLKGSDAAIEQEANQLRTIMVSDYADTGSYRNTKLDIQASAAGNYGWILAGNVCDGTLGTYAAKETQICNEIIKLEGQGCPGAANGCLWTHGTAADSPSTFTIMVYLPGASVSAGGSQYLCIGSSGRSGIYPGSTSAGSGVSPGCWANP